MGGNLVACLHLFDFGEEGTKEELVGVIMNMTKGVAVGDGADIGCSVVTTGTPTVVLFEYDVGRRGRSVGIVRSRTEGHGVCFLFVGRRTKNFPSGELYLPVL
jgi:hypothetical protein